MNTEQPNPQPTILPWHREAAKEITAYYSPSKYAQNLDAYDIAAIIARHDATNNEAEAAKAKKTAELFVDATGYPEELRTLKAQHAATLRLLERCAAVISNPQLHGEIRAHLAAMKGNQ